MIFALLWMRGIVTGLGALQEVASRTQAPGAIGPGITSAFSTTRESDSWHFNPLSEPIRNCQQASNNTKDHWDKFLTLKNLNFCCLKISEIVPPIVRPDQRCDLFHSIQKAILADFLAFFLDAVNTALIHEPVKLVAHVK